MPNWCSNKLEVTGEPDKLAVFFQALGENKTFSFGKFLPVPEPMRDILTGGTTIDGEFVTAWRETQGENGERIQKAVTKEEVQELTAKYGSADWYHWSIANWGTKWDVDETEMNGDPSLGVLDCHFDTAWSPPIEFIATVSENFPELTFTLYYAEGGVGFWGSTSATNGQVEETDFPGFWKSKFDDDAEDYTDNCIPELQEFLKEHGLHTGG